MFGFHIPLRWMGYRYIGSVSIKATDFSGSSNQFYRVAMYATKSGRRAYKELGGERAPSEMYRAGLSEIKLWAEGGPAPKNFEPDVTSLLEIAQKVVDKELLSERQA